MTLGGRCLSRGSSTDAVRGRTGIATLPMLLLLLLLLLLLTLAAAPAHAARSPQPAPVILSLTATSNYPQPLPSFGDDVTLTVHVRNASRCIFYGQRAPGSSLYPVKTRPCASGTAHLIVSAPPNESTATIRLHFAVRAFGARQRFAYRTVTVTEGGGAPEPTDTTPATPPTPADPPPANISTNWSGYVVPSSTDPFTSISGRFTVPTLDCASAADGVAASVWVGIGGDTWPDGTSSGPLLQTGITTTCSGGVQVNDGWWELYPSVPNRAASFLGFPVRAADQIEAMVFQSSTGAWETRVDDLSTGLSGVMVTGQGWGVITDNGPGTFFKQGSTALLTYAGGYSAEWIVEDFVLGEGMVPFANYGTVNFSDVRTSLSNWSLTPDQRVGLAQNGVVVSTPSLPGTDGFSVSYTGA